LTGAYGERNVNGGNEIGNCSTLQLQSAMQT